MAKRRRAPAAEPGQEPVREHWWASGECRRCHMTQTETWVRDSRGRPVMVLAWGLPDGTVVRVRQFAYFTGMEPPTGPLPRREERFPGVPVGSVPSCPGQGPARRRR